jgi:ADP-heptose:LPS heptosyltransferase
LLGKPWHKKFLANGRTVVDRVIVVPVKKGIREENNEEEDEQITALFFEAMREEHFDIAVNFQGNGISANPFIKKMNPRFSVGLTCQHAEPLDRDIDFYYCQNEAVRFMEVAKLIGARMAEPEPEVHVLQADEEEIATFLDSLNGQRFVVLQPCAVDIRRMWPLENYAPLADLIKERNFEVVFTGSGEDRNNVEEIIGAMKHTAINLCGKISLGGLTALLSKAALVIGADTGPMHLARAVNAPTVGIYWAPNLINWGPVTRAIHRPVVSWEMKCPYCGVIPNDPYPFEPRTHCDHRVSFVRHVTIEQVVAAADALLVNEQHLELLAHE